jgi:hypothetical protein
VEDGEDVSLFIGCLPGHVLFPDGQVIGDLRGRELGAENGPGEVVDDHGWISACAFIEALTNGNGWYIDEVTPDGNGWWLKPASQRETSMTSSITGVRLGPSPSEPRSGADT